MKYIITKEIPKTLAGSWACRTYSQLRSKITRCLSEANLHKSQLEKNWNKT